MKDQTPPLSASEMREAFDKARADARRNLEKTGASSILQHLSEAVAGLQANGADIRMTARANGHSNAYDMMYTISGNSGGTIDAYGYLKMGETSHLWAIASRHNNKDVERLYLSKNNIVEEGGRTSMDSGKTYSNAVIPGDCFDFATDPEALKKFQARLVKLCADNDVLLENDPGGVFNREPSVIDSLKKPAPKFRL